MKSLLHRLLPLASLLLMSALVSGCPPEEEDLLHVEIEAGCENINPHYCMLPWPSSRYLEADADTATGWRVAYLPESFPGNIDNAPLDVRPYNRQDGFPPSAQIITLFPEPVDDSTLPRHWDYDASLAADSPTVLLDMETGDRVAHFAEFDVRFEDPAEVLMYIRPAQRLDENRRYAVAIRDLSYESGGAVEASAVFAALRDGVITDSAQVEGRRASLEEVFTALTDAGVERASLIQAWDFHTMSGESVWGDMVAMRDDALDRVGDGGAGCTVTNVVDDYSEHIYRLVEGTFTVPLYLEEKYGDGALIRDADGRPEYQMDAEYRFTAMIPRSLAQEGADPGRTIHFGHGFFMEQDELLHSYMQEQADEQQLFVFGTDWEGMSTHNAGIAAAALANVSKFPLVTERLMQGMTNTLVLTRTMTGMCTADEAFEIDGQLVYDPSEVYYYGISMGGIMGAEFMALSQDIERGVFSVTATNFPVLEGRSINFDEFELIYAAWYESRIDREFYWSVMGHLWEGSEGAGYVGHITGDPLPDTEPKKVVYQIGIGDAQVTNVGTDMTARSVGVQQILPSNREIWGLEEATTPFDGSAIQYWDCGVPEAPLGNEAPEDNATHGCVRRQASAWAQMDAFWWPDGEVINPCDGPCDPN